MAATGTEAACFECDVARFQHDRAVRLNANVLRNRAGLSAEYFVAGF